MTNVMLAVKCFAMFGFGTSCMLFPMTNDMKSSLQTFNGNAKRKRNESNVVDQFAQIVQFHSKLIQLSQMLMK